MSFSLNELSSGRYRGTLVDENGQPFPSVDTLTLTLYNKIDRSIINGRSRQNVLNVNQVTLDPVTAVITWLLLPEDNPIINDGLKTETHVALFIGTWSSGTKQLTHEVLIVVSNLTLLP